MLLNVKRLTCLELKQWLTQWFQIWQIRNKDIIGDIIIEQIPQNPNKNNKRKTGKMCIYNFHLILCAWLWSSYWLSSYLYCMFLYIYYIYFIMYNVYVDLLCVAYKNLYISLIVAHWTITHFLFISLDIVFSEKKSRFFLQLSWF